MKQAPRSERINFYRYRTAHEYLLQAQAALEMVRRMSEDASAQQRAALWTAVHVCYWKVFRQDDFALSVDMIPQNLLDVHEAMGKLRNKIFAHTDSKVRDQKQHIMNDLAVRVEALGYRFGLGVRFPTKPQLERIAELLNSLIKKSHDKANRIWEKWAKRLALPLESQWTVNTRTDNDDVLIQK